MKNLVYILYFFCLISNAKTITVGKTYPVKTIKQALALANDGDTVLVTPGIYKEGNLEAFTSDNDPFIQSFFN